MLKPVTRSAPIRRVARRRAGLSAHGRAELDRMARTLTMLRAGAALFTDEGREQWWGACQRCQKETWLSWCHVITRGAFAVRWDWDNAYAWCSGCHRWLDQHAEEKREWVIRQAGEPAYMKLVMRSRGKRVDYAGVKVALAQEIARLTA